MIIQVYKKSAIHIKPNCVYRYLGYKEAPSAEIQAIINEFIMLAEKEAHYSVCYCSVPVSASDDVITFDNFSPIVSHKLAANLNGAKKALLFCATCGVYFDRKIASVQHRPSHAVIWDAIGTAAIEQLCDVFCNEMKTTSPRFSPGYGDLPLSFQSDMLQWLNASQLLGVGLTDSLLITPTKSVTAIAAQE